MYPNKNKTRLVGYDGMSPGPTFLVERGREAVVRFLNHADRNNSVHLHGAWSEWMLLMSLLISNNLQLERRGMAGRIRSRSTENTKIIIIPAVRLLVHYSIM